MVQRAPDDQVRTAVDELLVALDRHPYREQLAQLAYVRSRVDGHEARLIATQKRADTLVVRDLQDVGVSRAESKRTTNRSHVIEQKPEIGDRLTAGDITAEQVDVIARVAEQTEGASLDDEQLTENLLTVDPDQGRKRADRWRRDQLHAQEVEERYRRARKRRTVNLREGDPGEGILTMVGDMPTLQQLFERIRSEADRAYRAAGGRDIPADLHRETYGQRLFDTAEQLIAAPGARGTGTTSSVVFTLSLDTDEMLHAGEGSKPQDRSIEPRGHLAGRPVPKAVLEHAICTSALAGMVFDKQGQPLWLGRKTRLVSRSQRLALAVRDDGCVLCGRDHAICEAHHLTPWSANERGPTDIDNLALLCPSCHRMVHDSHKTLYHDPSSGAWETRTATGDEESKLWHGRAGGTARTGTTR